MTNEEAIKEIRGCFGFNKHIMPYPDEMEAFEMAITALEKSDKYRWHDLRRNPEDLPEDNEMVLVCYKFCGSHNSHKVAWFHSGQYDTCFYPDGNSRIELSMVIAWRSLEKFEEET